jgi:tol-pal system protein YbgF
MIPLLRTVITSTLVLALAAVATGCVLPDQFSKLQKDVSAMQAQLVKIEQEQREAAERLERVSKDVSATEGQQEQIGRAEFADLKLRLDEINRQQSILDERLIEANRRIDRMSQSVQENRELIRTGAVAAGAAAGAVGAEGGELGDTPALPGEGGAGANPSSALPSADDLYHTAYADFSKGNYALAISGFEEYATRYQDSDRADNALYWIGECYFSQGNHVVAVDSFDRMLERYPDSDRAAAANLKKGLAYLEQNQVRPAIIQLRFVVETFPESDEARVASDKLASLGAQ